MVLVGMVDLDVLGLGVVLCLSISFSLKLTASGLG